MIIRCYELQKVDTHECEDCVRRGLKVKKDEIHVVLAIFITVSHIRSGLGPSFLMSGVNQKSSEVLDPPKFGPEFGRAGGGRVSTWGGTWAALTTHRISLAASEYFV
jgi:hypothetical protein